MSSLSDYLEAKILNATLRGISFTVPNVGDLHLALFTADPTDANATENEINAPWYSRKPTGSWTSPATVNDVDDQGQPISVMESTNSGPITFDSVSDTSVVVTHLGIYDAADAGNLLIKTPLENAKTLDVGDVISFATGAIAIQLD